MKLDIDAIKTIEHQLGRPLSSIELRDQPSFDVLYRCQRELAIKIYYRCNGVYAALYLGTVTGASLQEIKLFLDELTR